jgi:hypothetical protein
MGWKHKLGLRAVGWAGLAVGLITMGVLALCSPRASGDPVLDEEKRFKPVPRVDDKASDLVVHEWGTFLGMNGSDGTALDGMYHEEHALPGFVHSRARDQLWLPGLFLKGETPVIYFYTPRPVSVRVGVDFPQGVWTHWYPQAALVNPPVAQQAASPDRPKDGRICWFAEVTPPPSGALPATSRDALWNFARDVDAAFVKTSDLTGGAPRSESERFLFYRGLGQARLPMRADVGAGGTLSLEREPRLGAGVRHVFILRVEQGRGAYVYRPALGPGERATGVIPSMDRAQPMDQFTEAIAGDLAARLTESGLYAKEARAMVNTWKNSYFHNDGIRVLFVLPQSWTDSFIPIRIVPKPREVVRVMVGRLELLSPERERRAEAAVRDLAASDPVRRQDAFAFLREQGRYVEPIVRRVARTTQDEGVRALCRRLLLTDFVTELRSAVHSPADGKRVHVVPLELRAQLARLYREMGMKEEARAEATALWRQIRNGAGRPGAPGEKDPLACECRAAVYEALGEDRRAAETYAGRVELQALSFRDDVLPQAIPWLRDWWVGRAYAGCLVRAGQAESTIAMLLQKLDRSPAGPTGPAEQRTSRILLAFLFEARGESGQAEALWSSLTAGPALALGR